MVVNASVRKRFCGTGPFDRYWLNVDCCGLFCAFLTYGLHMYALYTVCFILIPPWMSETVPNLLEPEGPPVRISTWAGMFHKIFFSSLTALAVSSHWMAMTKDPGAVPPDAVPVEHEVETTEMDSLNGPKKGHRLCRRCKTFKPERAHHCSVCKRCVVKMDHHW